MGLFSALAGVGTAIGGGIGAVLGSAGSLLGGVLNLGASTLTGITQPLLQVAGQAIGGLVSSGGPGATVTGPTQQQALQQYYVPPIGGGSVSPISYQPPNQWQQTGPYYPQVQQVQGGMMGQAGAAIQEFAAGSIASPWKTTCGGSSLAAQNHLQVNPATGAIRWFGPKGKPILWSDDLAACKRVKRVASRAGKVLKRGGR